MSQELHLRCCFCGKEIAEKPRAITVEADSGGEQRLFAHTACLRERLDPSVPLGQSGAFGVEFKNRRSASTLRRVIVVGLVVVLALLIPAAVIVFLYGR
jgi:hypothetical protein